MTYGRVFRTCAQTFFVKIFADYRSRSQIHEFHKFRERHTILPDPRLHKLLHGPDGQFRLRPRHEVPHTSHVTSRAQSPQRPHHSLAKCLTQRQRLRYEDARV